MALPVIDLSAWTECAALPTRLGEVTPAQAAVAAAWDQAMAAAGTALIVHHSLPRDLLSALNAEALHFFRQPVAEKTKWTLGKYGDARGGYAPPGAEQVALAMDDDSGPASATDEGLDAVESFVFRLHPRHFVLSSPFASAAPVYEAMERLLKTLHHLAAAALQLEDLTAIQRLYEPVPGREDFLHSVEEYNDEDTSNALRLSYYPALTNLSPAQQEKCSRTIRYGAHTDYLGFTILHADARDWRRFGNVVFGGLEIWHPGILAWLQVTIPPQTDALIILAGDLMQRWTGDLWHSPLHRVVNATLVNASSDAMTEEQSSEGVEMADLSRQVVVFFSGPRNGAVVDVLPISGRQLKPHKPIKAIDYLLMKLNRTNQQERF